jgi:hypothetical protein
VQNRYNPRKARESRVRGRVSSEVLSINIYSHRAMKQLLRGFNTA